MIPVVAIGGMPCPNLQEISITQEDRAVAGRFDIVFGINGYPSLDGRPLVTISDSTGDLTFISGYADRTVIDFKQGSISLRGRDLAAGLIGATSVGSFENQTVGEVAATIAARHGLVLNGDLPDLSAGRLFAESYTRTVLAQYTGRQTDWDILAAIAGLSGASLRVSGSMLLFTYPTSSSVVTTLAQQDCEELRLIRTHTLLEGAIVSVGAWDSLREEAIRISAGAGTQALYFSQPNLDSQRAQCLANQLNTELQSAAVSLHLRKRVDADLIPGCRIEIATGRPEVDGIYVVRSIHRVFSGNRGSWEELEASRDVWNN